MRSAEDIERMVKQMQATSSSELDGQIHDEVSRAVVEKAKISPTDYHTNVFGFIMRRRLVQAAAATAVFIVLLLGLFVVLVRTDESHRGDELPVYAARSQTAAELVSVISLSRAYRDGGMEAIEQQFEEAQKKVWPALRESVEVDRLISEL